MIENEMKLEVPEGFLLPALDGAGGLRASDPTTTVLHTTYWDTDDNRIARWDGSLRHRDTDGWTVKLRADADRDDMMRRIEITIPGAAAAPHERAVDILRAFVRTAALRPVATLVTSRTMVLLRDGDGVEQAEVVNDLVTVHDGPAGPVAFQEVEVELREQSKPEVLEALVERLRAAGAGAAGRVSKQRRILGPVAPPEISIDAPRLGRSHDLLGRHLIALASVALIQSDPPLRIGADSTAADNFVAHVATLRVLLRAFAGMLEKDSVEWCDTRLARLAESTGADDLLALLRDRGYADLLDVLVPLAAGPTP